MCVKLGFNFYVQLKSHCWTVISLSISSLRTFTSLLLEGKMRTSSSCLLFFKAFSMLLHFFWGICLHLIIIEYLNDLNNWVLMHLPFTYQEQCGKDGSSWEFGSHLSLPRWNGRSGVWKSNVLSLHDFCMRVLSFLKICWCLLSLS